MAVERQPRTDEAVEAMRGGHEILAAVPDPLHRTAETARRPQQQHPFRIEHVLHPEAAADIGNADAKLFAGNKKHVLCEQVADRMRPGGRRLQMQTAARSIELAERATGFQGCRDDAVVD